MDTDTQKKLSIREGTKKLMFAAVTSKLEQYKFDDLYRELDRRSCFKLIFGGGSTIEVRGEVISRFQIADIEDDKAARVIEDILNKSDVAIRDVEQQ